jgi:hypothetical protein
MDISQPLKMVSVEADQIESVGFIESSHSLYIKFRNSPPMLFEKVPSFRYQGFMAAPRKDAYFRTFIKGHFMAKETTLPGSGF